MGWFKRSKENISPDSIKRDIPDGQWVKCTKCDEIIHIKQLELNRWVCYKCNFHFRIGSKEYISFLFDEGTFKETDKKIRSVDMLKFVDTKKYIDRINTTVKQTGLYDAIRTGVGKIGGNKVSFAAMDFKFIGGSMGSVVGEKIARAAKISLNEKIPLIIISQSGGARMMEAAFSLMQLAKTSAYLGRLSEEKIPYISVLTDPTTGGITASYAMLGDVIIAEPDALIGFAGPRVIRETIGRDLPAGFQKSEFQQEHGFVDFVVDRKELREKIILLLEYLK